MPSGGVTEEWFSALKLALIVIDAEGNITFLNPAAEEWLGMSAKQAQSRPLKDFMTVDERLMMRILSGARLSAYAESAQMADGRHMRVALHAAPLEEGGACLLADAQAHGQAALLQAAHAEENRAGAIMAAMLAHEVKNPLSGIRGAAQLLADEVSPESRSLAELICKEVDRITGLLSRVAPDAADAPPRAANVHEALAQAQGVAEAGFARHVRFRAEYDPSLPEAAADHDALVQLLLNLLKNAAEAMEGQKDARITLRTAYSFEPTMKLALTVEDNGPGIPPEIAPRLFGMFVSEKGEGRGLGLAIALRIAAGMGGLLTLEETRPGLTRFRLLLRAA